MSSITHKAFMISPKGMIAKDWDGVTDSNGDGNLKFKSDGWKNYEINPSGLYYYNQDGSVNVEVTVEGTCLR
jgi:hypothetical protein